MDSLFGIMVADDDHFADIMKTIVFFTVIFIGGVFFDFIGGAPLVAEIIIGIVLGPNGFNFVPEPEAIQLYGELGLMLLLLEAGLSVDIGMMAQLGIKAVFVAVVGSFLPIGIGLGLTMALGYPFMTALAIGCVLAPTSTGIAIEVFKSMNALSSPTGQLVTTAAVIDDVISLVVLAELQAMVGEPTTWEIIRPVLTSLLFIVVLGGLSIFVPGYLAQFPGSPIQKIPFKYHKSFTMTVVMLYGAALAAGCHYAYSSHLLGVFLAGLGFCRVKMLEHHWEKNVAPLLSWLLKAFFAATVAFKVPPYTVFLDGYVIGVGFLFLVPVIGKLMTGFFVRPLKPLNFFKIGFAMAAWGEIAFIIASVARDLDLLPEDLYASVVFAVLISALTSPFILRFILTQEKQAKIRLQEKEAREKKGAETVYWSLIVSCASQWGLYDAIQQAASNSDLEVVEAKLQTDHATEKVNDRIILRDSSRDPTTPERKNFLKNAFQKCVNDKDAELTLYRWYSDNEITDTAEEFVHVDSDQFSEDDEDSHGQMIPLDDDNERINERINEQRRPLIEEGKTSYGGTD